MSAQRPGAFSQVKDAIRKCNYVLDSINTGLSYPFQHLLYH